MKKSLFGSTQVTGRDYASLHHAENIEEVAESTGTEIPRGNVADFVSRTKERDRALTQVNNIAQFVSDGHDDRAERFLGELVRQQLQSSGTEFAVKSLCNLAKQCSNLFRVDFEERCLDWALRLQPDDPWTLIQWADYLKRAGRFQGAITALDKAKVFAVGESVDVALSSLADVWTQQAEYDNAARIYKSIPNWESKVKVVTALADISRFRWDVAAAECQYDRIIKDFVLAPPEAHARALAGKAEIAKCRGNLIESLRIYDSLVSSSSVDEHSGQIYRLAKCHVQKLMGNLEPAYQLADELVQTVPFSMQARIQRSSIQGMLGQAELGLVGIPTSELPAAFGQWMRQYVRGLLLLKLDRFVEAKEQLVDGLEKAIRTRDEDAILRLGAAFAFIVDNDADRADAFLRNVGETGDVYTRYLHCVLRLHVATVRKDFLLVRQLAEELKQAAEIDSTFGSVVRALRDSDFSTAQELTCKLLLSVA